MQLKSTLRYQHKSVILNMKQPKQRKRGGQRKPASERKRNNLTIRLVDDLRRKLQIASHLSGRSLSEEAAWRLTMSFMFNHEIQAVSQIKRGLGDVMVEGLIAQGWGVGPEDPEGVVRAWLDKPQDRGPIFMPPEQQQRLKQAA